MLTDEQCAIALGISQRTVYVLRRSDAFRATLSLMIDKYYGDAIRAVRSNTIVAANEALEENRRILRDPAALPSLKMEAAKIVLDHYHKSEDRTIPRGPVGQPGQTSVTINLTTQELAEARQASIQRGATLELEASNHAHAAEIPRPDGRPMLPPIDTSGGEI